MLGKGWVTGSDIISRPYTGISQEDWDRIFKPKKNDNDNGDEQSKKGSGDNRTRRDTER